MSPNGPAPLPLQEPYQLLGTRLAYTIIIPLHPGTAFALARVMPKMPVHTLNIIDQTLDIARLAQD